MRTAGMKMAHVVIDLTQMCTGESGVVAEFHGGHDFTARIQSLGLRPGKKITKISSHFWHGPQTVKIGALQIAIGFGMARKVFVEVAR